MSNLETLKPFQSGHDPRRNTKGRPPGPSLKNPEFRELVARALDEMAPGTSGMTNLEAIIMRVILDARRGHIGAYKILTDILYGKPVRTKMGKSETKQPLPPNEVLEEAAHFYGQYLKAKKLGEKSITIEIPQDPDIT